MVFYLMAKFFHFTAQRKDQQQNVRFAISENTGLNIIPVDYVSKVIVSTFERADIVQLNIVHNQSFNLIKGLQLIMKEVGYSNFSIIPNSLDFDYKNTIEKSTQRKSYEYSRHLRGTGRQGQGQAGSHQ